MEGILGDVLFVMLLLVGFLLTVAVGGAAAKLNRLIDWLIWCVFCIFRMRCDDGVAGEFGESSFTSTKPRFFTGVDGDEVGDVLGEDSGEEGSEEGSDVAVFFDGGRIAASDDSLPG